MPIVGVAIALGRGMAIVQVGEERPVGAAEVLPIQVEWILVQVVLQAHQDGPAVLGVDPGPWKGSVEPVDSAWWEAPDSAGRVDPTRCVERLIRATVAVDGQHR